MTTTNSLAKPPLRRPGRIAPPTRNARHAIALLSALTLLCNGGVSAGTASGPTINEIRTTTHFLEQATFGPSAADVSWALSIGLDPWLNQQFSWPESPMPDGLDSNQVRSQLFLNMANGTDQLRQRTVFALSQIIVVSAVKNGSGEELAPWVRLLSRNAFGNYRTLLTDVTLSPTMGKFLDLAYNRKATSTSSPNENYARELMQLFTIGLWELNRDGSLKRDGNNDPIPTYSQTTIKEMARALTGWTYPTQPGSTPSNSNPPYLAGNMEPRVTTHDTGAKTLLIGATLPAGQSTTADMQATLDNIFQHPNVPPFVATRLIRSLVTSNPGPAYIERVADVFADNGSGVRGDMKSVLRAVLMDAEALRFTAPEAGRLKDPILHIIGMARALGARITDPNTFMYVFGNLSERVLTAPTVFSFFSPLATLPGETTLFAPEFQIYPAALAVQRANFIYGILAGWYGASFTVDLTPFQSVAGTPATLVTKVDHALMFGRMSTDLRQVLITATTAASASSARERALGALYLTAISGEYTVAADALGDGLATMVLPPPVAPVPWTGVVGGGGSGGGSGGGGGSTDGMSGGAPMPMPPPPSPASPPATSTTSPTNLTGTANGFVLALSWQNPIGPGTPSSVLLDVSGPVTTSIPLGAVQFFSYPAVPAGTYTFSVRAVTATGPSAPSNPITLSFPGTGAAGSGPGSGANTCTASPQAPTNLAAARTGNLVALTWLAAQGGQAVTSYVVNVTGAYVGSFTTPVPSIGGTVGPGVYVVNVQAVNGCGMSTATPPVTVAVQ